MHLYQSNINLKIDIIYSLPSPYFSREFSLEITIQILSQSVKICWSYAASQFEKHGFEKNAFKVLSDIIFYL